ncbi:putative ribonuclease H-like domain-containing protein [Tanacetum coccineum]
MQAQEQEELSIKEKATLFQQLLEKRRKHFAAKRAEEKRNKPPTKAQQRKIMCTYLKNMEGYKLKDLKLKEFDSIQEMFDRAFKRVNTFEDFRTELVEGKEKRAGTELVQEITKKQKVEDDKETVELKQCLEIIPDEEEVTIDAIPLAVKSPSIVGWKIYKEGRKSYYQIMRADGKSQMYMIFSQMLKSFDREDLEDLYKLVKAKYESTRPVEDLDLLLWGDLKTMFEPHVEDKVTGQNRHEDILDLDVRHLHFLLQEFPEMFPSEMVLHQLTLRCSPHSLFLDNTVKFVVAKMQRSGPEWLFDIDTLPKSMNYKPVVAGNQTNGNAVQRILDAGFKPSGEEEKKDDEDPMNKEEPRVNQENDASVNSTNSINTVSSTVNVVGIEDNAVDENIVYGCEDDPNMPNLEEIIYSEDDEGIGAEADMNNLNTFMPVSLIPTTRLHKDHPFEQIIRDIHSAPQTRRMTKSVTEHEPKKVWTLVDLPHGKRAIGTKWVYRNKKDDRGIVVRNKARLVAQGYTQEEGIDYDEVFALVARIEAIRLFLAYASFMNFIVYQMDVKSAFLYGTIEEEVYVCQPPGFEDPEFPNKVYKVEKALYGLHQAPRAWYETLSTYLLENGFRRGTIDKTLFIKKDKGDILLVQVYVDDIIFGSTKKSLCTEFEQMMHKRFQMSSMGELTFFLGLQVKQKDDGIFISQDKYVADILKKFDFATVKTASTPMETNKALLKDEEAADVDVHLYRSMIGSLMYLTASRPDIMFAVCACARFQVTPKTSHLHAVKRIFRYLKGHPKLGLWYPRDSPFDLEAFSDSDYAGASLDRKSTTGGCQFLGRRLISWQCKKQTIVANSTTKAEYVATANCCGQVLWIQNQLLDYGYNFMNTKIFIDNESTICIVKNPVFHSKTKHIEIRHHFIKDSYEKRLIQVIKIYTDHNVADLLTKAFDVSRFQYLIASIGMLNL